MQLNKTIIPSIRNIKYLSLACEKKSPVVLLSNINIGNLKSLVKYVHECKKEAFAHLELIDGFNPDTTGLKLLKNMYHLDGVFTTNIQAANIAKRLGLTVIYRVFLIDSRSLKRATNILKKSNFDAIEVLPAYAALHEIEHLKKLVNNKSLIFGGFINNSEIVQQIFDLGVSGITTSTIKLW